jgi:O-antigen/teichoic acid export membrane protein
MSNNWLFQKMQKWTPFSAIAVLIVVACLVILILFPLEHIEIPSIVYAILTAVGGVTGSIQLVAHGVTIANGVAKSTASETVKAVSSNLTISNKE